MIRCLFAQISRNQRGQPIRKELLVTGETLQIGRAAGCKILLLDHLVRLHHAAVRRSDDGKLYIESEEGADILINGSFASSAEFTPGTHVAIGPYELIAEKPVGNYDLAFSVEMVHPSPGKQANLPVKRSPASLAETGLSKRKLARLLVGAIILVCLWFLAIPGLAPAFPQWVTDLPILNNAPWQFGEMSRGHHLISAKCTICHLKAFEAVPDKACENCHKTAAVHIRDKALQADVFKDTRCGECHHDHRGEKKQAVQSAQCVTCHANIKKKNGQTKQANVRDFGVDHPAFGLAFKTGHRGEDEIRIPQHDKARLIEKSGLKFPHASHIGMVSDCSVCHQPDMAGVGFNPITMRKTCQQSGCHALDFIPPTQERQLPHGPERNLMIALREHYATMALKQLAAGEKLPCASGGGGKSRFDGALNCVNRNAEASAEALFTPGNGCGKCHEISRAADDKEVPWKVAPVTLTRHWMPHAHFPHASHSTTKCTACHGMEHSASSADVTIPAVEKCRECHTGAERSDNRISSNCVNCHGFHNYNTHHSSASELN